MDFINHLNPTQQFLLFCALKVIGVFAVLMGIVAYIVLVERRICAFMQDRVGPNRVGPSGLLQPAGGFKGTGLAVVMGVLSSFLSGAAFGSELGDMVNGPRP